MVGNPERVQVGLRLCQLELVDAPVAGQVAAHQQEFGADIANLFHRHVPVVGPRRRVPE
jgi:hypothetical protein